MPKKTKTNNPAAITKRVNDIKNLLFAAFVKDIRNSSSSVGLASSGVIDMPSGQYVSEAAEECIQAQRGKDIADVLASLGHKPKAITVNGLHLKADEVETLIDEVGDSCLDEDLKSKLLKALRK